jgi:hypothetical protein
MFVIGLREQGEVYYSMDDVGAAWSPNIEEAFMFDTRGEADLAASSFRQRLPDVERLEVFVVETKS